MRTEESVLKHMSCLENALCPDVTGRNLLTLGGSKDNWAPTAMLRSVGSLFWGKLTLSVGYD